MGKRILLVTLGIFSNFVDAREGDRKVIGSYEVPYMGDDALVRAASRYEITYKIRDRKGDGLKISYDLPLELTGAHNDIDLRRSSPDGNEWRGDNSEGTCHEIEGRLVCRLKYKNLTLDPVHASDIILEKFLDEKTAQAKEDVMYQFQSEGIGILDLRL